MRWKAGAKILALELRREERDCNSSMRDDAGKAKMSIPLIVPIDTNNGAMVWNWMAAPHSVLMAMTRKLLGRRR